MVAKSGCARRELALSCTQLTHTVSKIPNGPIESDQQGAASQSASEHDALRRRCSRQDFGHIMIVEPTRNGDTETKLAREPRRIAQGRERPAPFGIGQIDEIAGKELDVGYTLRVHGTNRVDLRRDSNTRRNSRFFEGTQNASERRSSHTGIDRRRRPGRLMTFPNENHPIWTRFQRDLQQALRNRHAKFQ